MDRCVWDLVFVFSYFAYRGLPHVSQACSAKKISMRVSSRVFFRASPVHYLNAWYRLYHTSTRVFRTRWRKKVGDKLWKKKDEIFMLQVRIERLNSVKDIISDSFLSINDLSFYSKSPGISTSRNHVTVKLSYKCRYFLYFPCVLVESQLHRADFALVLSQNIVGSW